jgi:hypothetical protein
VCGRKASNNEILFVSPLKYGSDPAVEKPIRFGSKNALGLQRALSGESGSGSIIDYRKVKALSAWRPVKSLGWGLVAKVDASEAFLPIDKLRNLLITTIVITVFSIVLTALFIAKSIADPIDRLRRGAKIILKRRDRAAIAGI